MLEETKQQIIERQIREVKEDIGNLRQQLGWAYDLERILSRQLREEFNVDILQI